MDKLMKAYTIISGSLTSMECLVLQTVVYHPIRSFPRTALTDMAGLGYDVPTSRTCHSTVLFYFADRHGMSVSASETQTVMGWPMVKNWETLTASGKRAKCQVGRAPVTLVGVLALVLHADVRASICVCIYTCVGLHNSWAYWYIFYRYMWALGWPSLCGKEWLGLLYTSEIWMPTSRDNTRYYQLPVPISVLFLLF